MSRVLIVAYGNPLRSDDGLAWRAADVLEGKLSSSAVEILRVLQLTPELAETICRCDAVIFVDAAAADGGNGLPGEVRFAQIDPFADPPRFSHQLSPGAVMALARRLYSARARAFSVTLTGESFAHGESFSPTVEAAIPTLEARIEALVESLRRTESFPLDSHKA